MELKLNYTVQMSDFREANYYGLFLRKKNAFRAAVLVILAFFIYGVLCLNKVLPFEPAAMIPAAVCIIWVLLQLASAERSILRYAKTKDNLIGTEYTLQFQGKKFTIEIPKKNYHVSGDTAQFQSAVEISHCFLLCVTGDQIFIVPIRDMSAEEIKTLRSILTKELGDRFFTGFTRRKKA